MCTHITPLSCIHTHSTSSSTKTMEWHRSSPWLHPSLTNCAPLSWSIHWSSASPSSSKTVQSHFLNRTFRNALHRTSQLITTTPFLVYIYVLGIDANATSIEVKVDVAGHSLQVSDNGDGILPADMALIGARYATSKCSSLQDLNRITTYGFRGEGIEV